MGPDYFHGIFLTHLDVIRFNLNDFKELEKLLGMEIKSTITFVDHSIATMEKVEIRYHFNSCKTFISICWSVQNEVGRLLGIV